MSSSATIYKFGKVNRLNENLMLQINLIFILLKYGDTNFHKIKKHSDNPGSLKLVDFGKLIVFNTIYTDVNTFTANFSNRFVLLYKYSTIIANLRQINIFIITADSRLEHSMCLKKGEFLFILDNDGKFY